MGIDFNPLARLEEVVERIVGVEQHGPTFPSRRLIEDSEPGQFRPQEALKPSEALSIRVSPGFPS